MRWPSAGTKGTAVTCGLRPGEGRLLRVEDVDLDAGIIHISDGKCHIDRVVALSDDMSGAMKSYAQERVKVFPFAKAFFVNKGGDYFTQNQVALTLQKCWRACNPDTPASELPRIRVYDLRHRFATAALNRWLDEKRDLYVMLPYLSAYMGHSSLPSTAYYIHLLPENLTRSPGVDWSALNDLIPEVDVW